MTNKDYLISLLGYTPTVLMLEGLLLNQGLTGNIVYVETDYLKMKRALHQGLLLLLSTPDIQQGNGETSNSIKYDRKMIHERILMLEKELGIYRNPTIKGKQPW